MPTPSRLAPCTLALTLLLFGSCATPTPTPRSSTERTADRSGRKNDTIRLAQLERDARALAKAEGCDAAGSCRTAPVGWRGCGGPRSYVAYCPARTDTVALLRKLEELRRAEMEHNEREGIVSTCEYRVAPAVAVVGGVCTAAR